MEGRPLVAFTVAQIVAAAVVLWLIFSRPVPWDLQRSVGAALVAVGYGGIAAARYQLGKSFSLTPQARQLVTRGIYSKIRNPIYVFGTVAIAGLILLLRQPSLWLLLVLIVIMQTLRARREAQVLEAAFGDAYPRVPPQNLVLKSWF
jgi:protein-S-isoprenylcysteine O-methyltransferase Ste14